MKVRYIQLTGASGSIAGTTAARNRGGDYWRARVTPVNPQTVRQIEVRQSLADWSTSWANLTLNQRSGWQAYANSLNRTNPLGVPYALSGMNAYVGTNSLSAQLGGSEFVATPINPGVATFTAPESIQYAVAADTLTLDITLTDSWAATMGGRLGVYVGMPVSSGVSYYKGPYRLWYAQFRGAVAPTDPLVLTGTADPYGGLAEGQNRFVRIATIGPDGRLSTPWRGSLTIVA